MLDFLLLHKGNIIVGLVLILVVFLIIRNLLKNKKQGKSSCGCGCSSCASNGICHTKKK